MTRLANLSQWFKRVIKIDLGHIHCAFNELGLTDLSMAARITIWPLFLVMHNSDWFTQFMNVTR